MVGLILEMLLHNAKSIYSFFSDFIEQRFHYEFVGVEDTRRQTQVVCFSNQVIHLESHLYVSHVGFNVGTCALLGSGNSVEPMP